MRVVNWVDKGLSQQSHSSGRLSVAVMWTSEAKRCVILWRVHILKIRRRVCLSLSPSSTFVASLAVWRKLLWMKFMQKACDPIGTPRILSPSQTSCGCWMPFASFLVEYVEMAVWRSL